MSYSKPYRIYNSIRNSLGYRILGYTVIKAIVKAIVKAIRYRYVISRGRYRRDPRENFD